jgi:hypothetical protein
MPYKTQQYPAFFIFCLACLFAGCSQSPNPEEQVRIGALPEIDTFYFGNRLVHVKKSDKNTFDKLPGFTENWNAHKEEKNKLKKDAKWVYRNSDTLFFNIAGNKKVTLVNSSNNLSDNTVVYHYVGVIPELNKYLIFAALWEGFNYVLIDKETGDTTITIGFPVASPDKKYFVCGNCDLIAGYTFNGIELYTNENKPKQLASRELKNWGINNIRWLDNSSLIVSASFFDTASVNYQRTEYLKLRWNDKAK